MERVAIIGVGQTKFSRACGMRVPELAFEAYRDAMQGHNLKPGNIDASIICSSMFDKQRTIELTISDYLGLTSKPTFSISNACAASTTGVRAAWSLITSGFHKAVVVIGVEKMSGLSSREVAEMMGRAYDMTWESTFGFTMPAGYALYARGYMNKYGLTEEHLAKVRVKSSIYGAKNPLANYQKEIPLEQILNADPVAKPLKKFDCCANADGASCVILATESLAHQVCDNPIWIKGMGAASGSLLPRRTDFTSLSAARAAAKQAYTIAGIQPSDVDVAEVHDCFTIAEVMAYEDLGFAGQGQAGSLIDEKQTYIGGRIPVNVDGGLLSKGHPVGATGGSQIRTIVKQLRGEMGETQVKDAKIGSVHNVGGVGHFCNVTILSK